MSLRGTYLPLALGIWLLMVCAPGWAELDSEFEVRVGVITPLSGGLASLGEDVTRTLTIFEKQVNRSTSPYRFHFVMEDGRCGVGNQAVNAANKLIRTDQVKFLIVTCSGEALQAAPLAEREGIVTIAVVAGHPDIKKLGDYIFRTYVDLDQGAQLVADTIIADGHSRLILISEDAAFTKGIESALVKALGSRILRVENYPAEETDFRTLLLRVRQAQPDALYLNAAGARQFQALVNQLQQSGLSVPRYSYSYPEHPDVLKTVPASVEGMRYFATPDIENSAPDYVEAMQAYRSRYPAGPSNRFASQSAYDAARALRESIIAVGKDPAQVKRFLYSYDRPGALGRVRFDKNGDIVDIRYIMKEIRKGRGVPLAAPEQSSP